MGTLAGLLHARGHDVRGSDGAIYPPMDEQLAELGIPVFQGFSPENLSWKPDVVVVGNVCRKDHVEVEEAKRLGLPLTSMPALLGDALIGDKTSVVVTGTHGKTTTTSMISQISMFAGRDPSVFVGGIPIHMGRGWRFGTGPEFIVEGDEYDSAFFDKRSKFLHYRPHSAVLTSVELDHVDIFSTMDEVRNAFAAFVALIPEDGLLVAHAGCPETMAIAKRAAKCHVQTYVVAGQRGGEEPEPAEIGDTHWVAREVTYTKSGRCRFELYLNDSLFDRYETLLIGWHNVGNTVAAIAIAHSLGVARDDIRRGVAIFPGVKRRQEVFGIAQGVYVLDDYAHHPTAVEETLRALRRRFDSRRLMAVFEPRSATSRRKTFQHEFIQALSHADVVVVGRLHDPSRIPEDQRLDPQKLALELHNRRTMASYIDSTDDIVKYLVGMVRPGDVIAILSSGSFDGLHRKLLSAIGDPICPATPKDMDDVRSLASVLGWSTDSLGYEAFGNFLILSNETGFVGCVGLEVYGEASILRSLAVKESARGVGYGWLLADTVVKVARHRGVKRIYLFTEDASDYFAQKLGFRVVDVSTVSRAVTESPMFKSQYAIGATAMRLDL